MRIRTILADDHEIFRQGLSSLLEAEVDIELVALAADGRQAWELVETLQPNIAILDVGMPEISGIEIARRIEESSMDTRVVLLTMHDDPCTAADAQQAGASGYVLKDNSFEELLIAVRTVAAGGTFVTLSIQAQMRELKRNGVTTVALSPREREVIRLIALGNSSKEVARILGISPRTVDTYRNRLMSKLSLRSLADIVRYAVRVGMLG